MVIKELKLVWTKHSQLQLKAAHKYISEDSPKNALKVITGIIFATTKATKNPEFYNPDKYKINNDGSYRAFEIYHYRISYRFSNKTVRVLRVRHTKMLPKTY
jgi:plasmid stabilization system protein ParE